VNRSYACTTFKQIIKDTHICGTTTTVGSSNTIYLQSEKSKKKILKYLPHKQLF